MAIFTFFFTLCPMLSIFSGQLGNLAFPCETVDNRNFCGKASQISATFVDLSFNEVV